MRRTAVVALLLGLAGTVAAEPGRPAPASPSPLTGVFPVGIYLDTAIAGALPAIRRQGFDTVWVQAEEPLLDEAGREGLRVIAHLDANRVGPGRYGAAIDLVRARALVARHRGRPSVWLWDVVDEPDVWKVPPAQMAAARAAVRRADPARLVYTVVARPERYAAYAEAGDVLAVDCYPVPVRPVDRVVECLTRARGAAAGRPVFAVIQAFKPVDAGRRPPTPAEVRAMTWLAVAGGARGVLFYTYGYGAIPGTRKGWTMPRDTPALWNEVGRLAAELRRLAPVLLAPEGPGQPAVGPVELRALARLHEGAWYVVVANPTARRVTARVRLPHGVVIGRAASLLDDARLVFRRGELDDEVPPLGAKVYRLEVR